MITYDCIKIFRKISCHSLYKIVYNLNNDEYIKNNKVYFKRLQRQVSIMEYRKLLDKLIEESYQNFMKNLIGIYLHGSMTMECFNPVKSDLDILVVLENEITDLQKKNFMDIIISLNDAAPAKGIELF